MSRLFKAGSFQAAVGHNEPVLETAGCKVGEEPAGGREYDRISPDGTVILSPANARALTGLLDKIKERADVDGWRSYAPLAGRK